MESPTEPGDRCMYIDLGGENLPVVTSRLERLGFSLQSVKMRFSQEPVSEYRSSSPFFVNAGQRDSKGQRPL